MTITSILVHLTGLPPDENAVAAALSIGRRFDAHIEMLHVRRDPVLTGAGTAQLAGGVPTQVILDKMEEDFARRTKIAKEHYARVETALGSNETVTVSWAEEAGDIAAIVAEQARFADLVVLTAPSADIDVLFAETVETVLFQSGRPILLIPPNTESLSIDSCVIGWDGSPHATRALFDSIPLLHGDAKVTVLAIGTDDDLDDPDQVCTLLKRHGIRAASETIAGTSSEAGDILLEMSASTPADLIVMGGYGKHPLREFIFGGATRTILNSTKIPVLISH